MHIYKYVCKSLIIYNYRERYVNKNYIHSIRFGNSLEVREATEALVG